MSPAWRRTLHWLGSGLALAGVGFVAARLSESWGSVDPSQITRPGWIVLASLAAVYGAANVLLALAWRRLMQEFGVPVTCPWSIRVYGMSQVAKYVPGNIFHLVGRQALGVSAGANSIALAKSTLWELGLLALAGALYGWLALPLIISGFQVSTSIACFAGTLCLVAYLLRRFVGASIAMSFGYQLLFLAISGGVFTAVLEAISSSSGVRPQIWVPIAGAYVVAWLAGLITPGAPAGVGVRESVLLLLLKGVVSEADLLLAVLAGRLVTVVGDAGFLIAAYLIPAQSIRPTPT